MKFISEINLPNIPNIRTFFHRASDLFNESLVKARLRRSSNTELRLATKNLEKTGDTKGINTLSRVINETRDKIHAQGYQKGEKYQKALIKAQDALNTHKDKQISRALEIADKDSEAETQQAPIWHFVNSAIVPLKTADEGFE